MVPSETHISRVVPLLARKYTLLPAMVIHSISSLPAELKSRNRTVPADVPSETHNCHSPLTWERSTSCVPLTPTISSSLATLPGCMSFTRYVPATVPSVRQSSTPVSALSALKYVMPFITVRLLGELPAARVATSPSMRVPATVPSEVHHSRPLTPSSARKRMPFPSSSRASGLPEPVGFASRVEVVPVTPSITITSRPPAPESPM